MKFASNHVKLGLGALALACVFACICCPDTIQIESSCRLTLAPADVASSGGGSALDAEKTTAVDLVRRSLNPAANLTIVPIQNKWDFGINLADVMCYTASTLPIPPISQGQEWNLITRTIVPAIYAESSEPGNCIKVGLGDVLQTLFYSHEGIVVLDQIADCVIELVPKEGEFAAARSTSSVYLAASHAPSTPAHCRASWRIWLAAVSGPWHTLITMPICHE